MILWYLGQKPEKREAQFCKVFNNNGWLGRSIRKMPAILDRMRITFRTFKMYKYYGTNSEFGKGNFRILFRRPFV
jgi:hypothetical protein